MLLTIFHDDHSNLETYHHQPFFLPISTSPETLVTIFIAIARRSEISHHSKLSSNFDRELRTSRNSPPTTWKSDCPVWPHSAIAAICPMVPRTHLGEQTLVCSSGPFTHRLWLPLVPGQSLSTPLNVTIHFPLCGNYLPQI